MTESIRSLKFFPNSKFQPNVPGNYAVQMKELNKLFDLGFLHFFRVVRKISRNGMKKTFGLYL